MPVAVEGVDTKILDPRSTWLDGSAYDAQARKLVDMANANGGKDNISVVLMREATEVPVGGWAKRLVRRLSGQGPA